MKAAIYFLLLTAAITSFAQAGLWTPGGAVYGFGGTHIQINHNGASTFGVGLRLEQYAIGNSDGPKINFYKAMSASKEWTIGIMNGVDVPDFAINENGSYSSGFGTPRLLIKAGGNVGIGTPSPISPLEVAGLSSTGLRLNGTNSDYEALAIYNTTASNLASGNGAVIQFYNNSNNGNGLKGSSIKSVSSNSYFGWESDLFFRTTKNNSYATQSILDAMVIKGGSGNVGIGTTSPTQKLTVNGTIYGKQVKVDLSVPGPDYVFEKSLLSGEIKERS